MAKKALSFTPPAEKLIEIYRALLDYHGPQYWWPGDSELEICLGAILTQNTSWRGVEIAIGNLKTAAVLDFDTLCNLSEETLAELIRPAGFYNLKARRIGNFLKFLQTNGGFDGLRGDATENLRQKLLRVNGIGAETVDSILLYVFERPVFVLDAYSRRLLARLGLASGKESYEMLRSGIEEALADAPAIYNEFHALIVVHCKQFCKKRPMCDSCILRPDICTYY